MDYKQKTSQINSVEDGHSKDIEQLYQIMILANELSKDSFKKEDFQAFTKANEIFNTARDMIQKCDKVESF